MNILDVAQNGLAAGAGLVQVELCEDRDAGRLLLEISDDGGGMDEATLQKATDPFFTTRTTREVGLGLPLLKMAAEMAGGCFGIESSPGEGARVRAEFALGHIDLMPMGDLGETVSTLAAAKEGTDIVFACRVREGGGERAFTFDTREARGLLGDVSFAQPEVTLFIRDYVNEQIAALQRVEESDSRDREEPK